MRPFRLIALTSLALLGAGCTLVLETVPHRTDVVVSVDGMTSDAMRADVALVDSTADAADAHVIDAIDGAIDDAIDDTIAPDTTDVVVTADAPADSFDSSDAFDASTDAPDLSDAIDARDIMVSADAGDARFDVGADARFDSGFFDVPTDRGFDSGFFDVPTDRGFDSGFFDVAPDRTGDTGIGVDSVVSDTRPIDARPADTGVMCLNDSDCYAQYCGCTACMMDQVVCGNSATEASCTLACPSGPPCPYTENVTCGCAAGTCVVVSRGGPGGAGTVCTSSTECMPGLLCCYPCGTAGCENVCTDVGSAGMCPIPL